MNRALLGLMAVLILIVGGFAILKNQAQIPSSVQPPIQPPAQTSIKDEFENPKKAAHFESNTPEHGSTLAAVPVNVVIDFNFDLAKGSQINITKNGLDAAIGETVVDKNKLSMRKNMDPESPDGVYSVLYKACWADGSCHDGSFQFKIDRSKMTEFSDETGKKEVTINLQSIAFSKAKVKVSKGTKVTWVNQDDTVHTVNTDSHPAHTYYIGQNSKDLKKGDSYSVTFSEPGIYLYHCTPHASKMMGQIIVE